MKNFVSALEIGFAGVATVISSTIQDWLGIVLTAINIIVVIVQLLRRIIPKIIDLIKSAKKAGEDGVIDEDEKKEIEDKLNDIKNDIDESGVNGNGQ